MIIAHLPEIKEGLAFETLTCCQRLLMADEKRWVKQEQQREKATEREGEEDVRDKEHDRQSGKNSRGVDRDTSNKRKRET